MVAEEANIRARNKAISKIFDSFLCLERLVLEHRLENDKNVVEMRKTLRGARMCVVEIEV